MPGSPFRNRAVLFLLASLILASFPAKGQESEEPASPAQRPVAAPVLGDILTLKNGTRIVGQIEGSGPQSFAVRILEYVDPLTIDRSFVVSIEYDNIDPIRSQRANAARVRDANAGDTVKADEISPQLARKLSAPFLKGALRYTGQDLIKVLEDVSRLSGAQIRIHQTVRDMDEISRRWTFVAPPSTTLLDLLQNRLLARFGKLKLEFQFRQVVVTVKEATDPRAVDGPNS